MKIYEISAYTVEEAKTIAREKGLEVITNVSQSWKNQKSPMTDKAFSIFAKEILEARGLDKAEGVGLIVAIQNGSRDTRERPYTFVNNVTEGRRKTKRVINITLVETGEVIGTAETKGDAEKLAKSLMTEYRQDMEATINYEVQEGKDLAFRLNYTPSASAVKGVYKVFGNVRD